MGFIVGNLTVVHAGSPNKRKAEGFRAIPDGNTTEPKGDPTGTRLHTWDLTWHLAGLHGVPWEVPRDTVGCPGGIPWHPIAHPRDSMGEIQRDPTQNYKEMFPKNQNRYATNGLLR